MKVWALKFRIFDFSLEINRIGFGCWSGPVEVVERNPDYDSDADWSLELEPMEGVDSGDELECVNTL
jgi:hypothetical protein